MLFLSLALSLLLSNAFARTIKLSSRSELLQDLAKGAEALQDFADETFDATVFALTYGLPLLGFVKEFNGAQGLAVLGTNKLHTVGQISASTASTVVAPNFDTIYAIAALDLAAQDVVITLPPIEPDRFYLFAFYDPFGDVFTNLGSVDGNATGRYLLRPSSRWNTTASAAGAFANSSTEYQGYIDSPTLDVTLLVRIELKNNSTDVAYVDKYLDQANLTTTNQHPAIASPLTPNDFAGLSNSTALSILQLTARLHERNPPESPVFNGIVSMLLERAGIFNSSYYEPPNVNLTLALETASTAVNASAAQFTRPLSNGWTVFDSPIQGSFQNGENILARALIAETTYLANTADQALYIEPGTPTTLEADQAYLLTFFGKPPVQSDGFWSVTMYGPDRYPIPNPLDIFSLGDRSNITYPDGTPVYGKVGGVNATSADEEFQILIQPADKAPPANWTSNWLPAPAGGGNFDLIFRLYAPTFSLLNCSYEYPLFTLTNAIAA